MGFVSLRFDVLFFSGVLLAGCWATTRPGRYVEDPVTHATYLEPACLPIQDSPRFPTGLKITGTFGNDECNGSMALVDGGCVVDEGVETTDGGITREFYSSDPIPCGRTTAICGVAVYCGCPH